MGEKPVPRMKQCFGTYRCWRNVRAKCLVAEQCLAEEKRRRNTRWWTGKAWHRGEET